MNKWQKNFIKNKPATKEEIEQLLSGFELNPVSKWKIDKIINQETGKQYTQEEIGKILPNFK